MSGRSPSILIVTESYDVGGLETYIAGQVRVMAADGWAVHLACGSEPIAEFLPPGLATLRTGLRLGPDSTVTDLVATVENLRALIREMAVTHVHAHPFTSLFPAMLAAALEGVPFILTLHGPASLSSGYGPFNDYLSAAFVLPTANAVLAVSEEVRDLSAPYVPGGQLCIQYNAIDVNRFGHSDSLMPNDAPWLVVSRLDAVKIHGIRQFVNQAHALGFTHIDIVGDGPGRVTLEEWLQSDGVDHIARFLGARSDVHNLMHSSAGVAGMGRVLLEGVACDKPVCMVGYDGVKGFVGPDLFRRAASANFSGRNLPNLSTEDLVSQLEGGPARTAELLEMMRRHHSEDAVWSSFAKQISAYTYSGSPLVRAIYSVLQAEEAAASQVPYLQSEELFYRIGRVLHSAAYFSPAAVEGFRFYESRMNALRWGREQAQVAATQREILSGMAHAEEHRSQVMKQMLNELRDLNAEGRREVEELAQSIKALEGALSRLDIRLQQQKTWREQISDAVRSRLGR